VSRRYLSEGSLALVLGGDDLDEEVVSVEWGVVRVRRCLSRRPLACVGSSACAFTPI
jgi:hypothetical protein